jgi:hypothetical protein
MIAGPPSAVSFALAHASAGVCRRHAPGTRYTVPAMSHGITVFLFTSSLFLGMLLVLEIGRRLGIRLQDDSSAAAEGIGAADGAVFAVLGLLIRSPSPERPPDSTRGGS